MEFVQKTLSDIREEPFTYTTQQEGHTISLQCYVIRDSLNIPLFSGLIPVYVVGLMTSAEHLIRTYSLAYKHGTVLWLPKKTPVSSVLMDLSSIVSYIF